MTPGFDAQRSNWVRADTKISPESMAKPGFELVWKHKLASTARPTNVGSAPSLLDFYIGYRGFRALGFVGSTSDRVTAYDTELGRVEWEKSFATGSVPAPKPGCPGGITAGVTRPTGTAYSGAPQFRGFGRSTPAKSGVGEPGQGAVTIRPIAPPPPPAAPPKKANPNAAAANAAALANSPFAPRVQWAVAIAGDGKLHMMYVSNGEEPNPAMDFLPAGANAHGLIVIDGVAYVATSGNCGGAADGVWALDLATKQVTQWKSASSVAGNAGAAFGPTGTLHVATAAGELLALSPRKLEPMATYKASAGFGSTPVIFERKGKDLVAVASKDGKIHLLDAANLSVPLDQAQVAATKDWQPGALTAWTDNGGTAWILAASSNQVVTYKVVDRNGVPALEAGWKSNAMIAPATPIVVSGVVFALSGGNASTPAVLYAFDGVSGKELWSSGKAITGFAARGSQLASGGTRVYTTMQDGTQYVFGFPIEH
jgi:outer membrane protein assembly factor BamB